MTIKIHLFYSFIAHAVMLAYLLSLPLHRGNLHFDSFGDIFVHLTSRDTASEQSGPMQKIQPTIAKKDVGKPAAKRESKVDKETQPPKVDIANEKTEQAVEYREPPGIPKNEIILKEDRPPVEVKEVRKKDKEDLEAKKIEEKEPLKIESPKTVEIKKTEETKSVQLAKAADTKNESKTEKVVEEKTAPEQMMTSEQPSRAPEEATEKEEVAIESAIKESSKVHETDKSPKTEDSSRARKTAGKKDESPKERSAKGKASEDVHPQVKEAQALPPGQTGVPDNTAPLDGKPIDAATPYEGKPGPSAEQVITTSKSETKEEMKAKERKPSAGIPVSNVLLLNDIKIEITVRDADASKVSAHLFMRAHPDADRVRGTGKQKEVGIIAEDSKEGSEIKRVLRIAKADKGLYAFVMTNKSGATIRPDVLFHLFEKKKSERVKNFKSAELSSNGELRIKFILPEGIFWDDEEYFTGTIESSDSMTKFNDRTGIT